MNRWTYLLAVVALFGCGSARSETAVVPGVTAVGRPGESLADFVPLVPAVDGEGECYGPVDIPDRGTVYGLRLDTSPERQVAIELDGERLMGYNDMRGTRRFPFTEVQDADFTSIVIDLRDGSVTVQNAPAGDEPEVVFYQSDEALLAEELDVPGQWVRRIVERCVGAGSLARAVSGD